MAISELNRCATVLNRYSPLASAVAASIRAFFFFYFFFFF